MTDHEIIDNIRSGNTQAFQLLVERHQEMVFRTAMGFVHVKEEAEDIAQEVFISVFRSMSQFTGQ
ncbi:MAG: sigma factor, partial [Bacilli bacterium]|nr:sigma factor [Bacilli bacterium]